MECNVYDLNLARVGVISTWVSMVWEEQYNSVGSFQIEVQQTNDAARLLKPDMYVGIKESDTLMIIKSVQISDGKIIAAGYPVVYILSDRVSTAIISNTNAETALRGLVSNMEPWPCLELGEPAGLTDTFSAEKSDATLLEYCESVSQAVDFGFKLRFDRKAKKMYFECYKPEKNANLRFSTLYGNMGGIEYSKSTANLKNVAVVAGSGEGDVRITVQAGDVSSVGANRREMYVDARQEQLEEGESDADYKARLVRYGEEKLISQVEIENFKFLLDDKRAKLGDLVTCNVPEIGVKLEVRIVGLTRTSQNNQTTVEASVGTPILIRRY